METKEHFKSRIARINDKPIWDFCLAESTGSIISFECGEKVKYIGKNIDIMEYEGEYSFMIYCTWKILNANKMITSWEENIGQLKMGASKLENLKILSSHISDSLDLTIQLENGFSLQVFCDKDLNSNFDCNWFFRDGQKYYSINNIGSIDVE